MSDVNMSEAGWDDSLIGRFSGWRLLAVAIGGECNFPTLTHFGKVSNAECHIPRHLRLSRDHRQASFSGKLMSKERLRADLRRRHSALGYLSPEQYEQAA